MAQTVPMATLIQNRFVRSSWLRCLAWIAADDSPKSRISSAMPIRLVTMATSPNASGAQQPREHDQRADLEHESPELGDEGYRCTARRFPAEVSHL